DYTTQTQSAGLERVESEHKSEWAHVHFVATDGRLLGTSAAQSRVIGKYLVRGQRTSRLARWDEPDEPPPYPQFIYDVDSASGALLQHTCSPDELGTYFDKDVSRLHYLTPIHFRPGVLQ